MTDCESCRWCVIHWGYRNSDGAILEDWICTHSKRDGKTLRIHEDDCPFFEEEEEEGA